MWHGDWSAFGLVFVNLNNTENNLRLPGQYYEAESNQYYNYHRNYSALIGRYFEVDPYREKYSDYSEADRYLYANANPLKLIDNTGLTPVSTCCADPCKEAKEKLNLDLSDLSGGGYEGVTICCNGKKYSCIYHNMPDTILTIIKVMCAKKHEAFHAKSIDCPIVGLAAPPARYWNSHDIDATIAFYRDEKSAWEVSLACLKHYRDLYPPGSPEWMSLSSDIEYHEFRIQHFRDELAKTRKPVIIR